MAPLLIQLTQFSVSIESDQAILSMRSMYGLHGVVALIGKDHAEHAMVFVRDTCGEIDEAIVPEQTPQALKLERDSKNVSRPSYKAAVPRVNIDTAIAEITYPQLPIHNF